MAADLARITYDPTRQYRSVITQQGRVTLEADNNEAAVIAGEALRLETIDIVGPTGTPDDGYKVGPGKGAGGVSIGPGTFYLGGWRLELDAAIDLSAQPDWLDMPPVAPAPPATTAVGVLGNRLVALLLTEQSVCAVEDQALREVALGGPDSAARARLMQQFLRLPLDGTTCPAGAAMISALLSAQGITIDPDTLQLMSAATLQAGFVPGPPATDPCTPTAAGGYLGADNQLVRVTVTAFDATAKTGTLLWGWNNASLLYRATMTDPRTLTLTGTPVDEEHAPQLGQAVEILRSRANLGDGNFIAAPQGFVTTLTQAYSFDTGELQLAVALPAEYQTDKNPLFVRLWQASVPFNGGQVTPLDATSGITVTITLPSLPTSIALRPFWRFAVRPATPVNIYPQRYQEAPQPPDGPRQWLADLAVVQAVATGSRLLADCRVPFLPLTEQSGACCGLVLGPKDVAGRGGLQAIMNKLAGTQSSVALLAGTYTLPAPLALGKQHSGLTLEACGPGVVLAANTANLAVFRFGLIVMDQASNVTLRGLSFTIPNVPQAPTPTPTPTPTSAPTTTVATNPVGTPVPTNTLTLLSDRVVASTDTANAADLAVNPLAVNTGRASASGLAINPAALNSGTANPAGVAINPLAANAAVVPATIAGVMAVSSPGLTVEECQFNVSPTSPYVFGAELILYGDATGLVLRRNQFAATQYQPGALVHGVLATVLNGNANSTLDSAEISDNRFTQLSAGFTAFSQLGMVRCTGNRVVQCGAGLYFSTSNPGATGEVLRQAAGDATQSATLAPALTAGMQPMMLASVLTQSSVFAANAPVPPTTIVSADARTVLQRDLTTRGSAAFRGLIPAVTAAQQTVTPATGVAAAAPAAAPAIDANLNTALNQVREMAIAAEIAGITLMPVLHLSGNDVALIATQTTPGVGIAVVLSPGAGGGTVLMTANRVVTPDTRTEAAAIMFPTVAAVTGNVFQQTGAISQPVIPAFMLTAEAAAQIEATANVVHFAALIAPARSNAAATTTWNFLNTVG